MSLVIMILSQIAVAVFAYATGFCSCQRHHIARIDIQRAEKEDGLDVAARWLEACRPSVRWFGLLCGKP